MKEQTFEDRSGLLIVGRVNREHWATIKDAPPAAPEAQEGGSTGESYLPEGVAFEQAAELGIKGRIIWALANLGRSPRLTKVYQKAQDPSEGAEPDKPSEFSRAIAELVSDGVILFNRNTTKVSLVYNSNAVELAVKCFHCQETAPAGRGKEEARKLALAAGFVFSGERAYCRQHKPSGASPGSPAPPTTPRAARRRRRDRKRS